MSREIRCQCSRLGHNFARQDKSVQPSLTAGKCLKSLSESSIGTYMVVVLAFLDQQLADLWLLE